MTFTTSPFLYENSAVFVPNISAANFVFPPVSVSLVCAPPVRGIMSDITQSEIRKTGRGFASPKGSRTFSPSMFSAVSSQGVTAPQTVTAGENETPSQARPCANSCSFSSNSGIFSSVREKPPAPECPPNLVRVSAAKLSALKMLKPPNERAEPRTSVSPLLRDMRKTGLPNFSMHRAATIPTTPWCQSTPLKTITRLSSTAGFSFIFS